MTAVDSVTVRVVADVRANQNRTIDTNARSIGGAA